MKIVAQHLGISPELCFHNELELDTNGEFLNFNTSQSLAKETGKGEIISQLKKQFPEEKIIFVGDSVGDMLAGKSTDLFVGYGGTIIRERVKKEAKHFIHHFSELEQIIEL